MFEIFMGASVPLSMGHESHEKEAKTEHKLDVKGNRDEIERTSVVCLLPPKHSKRVTSLHWIMEFSA